MRRTGVIERFNLSSARRSRPVPLVRHQSITLGRAVVRHANGQLFFVSDFGVFFFHKANSPGVCVRRWGGVLGSLSWRCAGVPRVHVSVPRRRPPNRVPPRFRPARPRNVTLPRLARRALGPRLGSYIETWRPRHARACLFGGPPPSFLTEPRGRVTDPGRSFELRKPSPELTDKRAID